MTYYDILGVPATATKADIKQAYIDLAKQFHPDKTIGANPAVAKLILDKFQDIQEAYETLSKHRNEYDNQLRAVSPPAQAPTPAPTPAPAPAPARAPGHTGPTHCPFCGVFYRPGHFCTTGCAGSYNSAPAQPVPPATTMFRAGRYASGHWGSIFRAGLFVGIALVVLIALTSLLLPATPAPVTASTATAQPVVVQPHAVPVAVVSDPATDCYDAHGNLLPDFSVGGAGDSPCDIGQTAHLKTERANIPAAMRLRVEKIEACGWKAGYIGFGRFRKIDLSTCRPKEIAKAAKPIDLSGGIIPKPSEVTATAPVIAPPTPQPINVRPSDPSEKLSDQDYCVRFGHSRTNPRSCADGIAPDIQSECDGSAKCNEWLWHRSGMLPEYKVRYNTRVISAPGDPDKFSKEQLKDYIAYCFGNPGSGLQFLDGVRHPCSEINTEMAQPSHVQSAAWAVAPPPYVGKFPAKPGRNSKNYVKWCINNPDAVLPASGVSCANYTRGWIRENARK